MAGLQSALLLSGDRVQLGKKKKKVGTEAEKELLKIRPTNQRQEQSHMISINCPTGVVLFNTCGLRSSLGAPSGGTGWGFAVSEM